ncbi:MAG: ATP-binding protein [Phycisphaerales bacterium]|nr:ATP-binding protein [Phycisphaerales bacterium]
MIAAKAMPEFPYHDPDFVLDLDARPDLLCVARSMIDAWCLRAEIDRTRADRICLAVDEAATNIMRHAYDNGPGRIRMRCARGTHDRQPVLLIQLEDDGQQVPLDTIRPRDLDDVRPGGLGVHLIQDVADEAVWSHRPTGGTLLTLRISVRGLTVTADHRGDPHA